MKTTIVERPVSTAAILLGALSRKRAAAHGVTALPEVTYVRPQVILGAGHVERYASVCGFTDEHGVPIIYPQLLAFPLVMGFFASTDCPWPALGTVHLANRIVQRQRLNPGDNLRVVVASGRMMAHEKGQIFTLEISITRADELVWEATQTLLRLGVQNPFGAPFEGAVKIEEPLSRQADFSAASNIGRRYARVSGDFNPIHLSVLSARLFGFRRAIAHGMWTEARALAALMRREPVDQATVEVDFKTPLFLPARASLWTTRDTRGAVLGRSLFEVRDARGDKPHLRGRLCYQ